MGDWWFITASAVTALGLPIALWCAWRAIRTARTPQGAVGWVVFLLSTPWIAVIAYLVFGQHHYSRRVTQRRESERITDQIDAFGERFRPESPPEGIDPEPFERTGRLRTTRGNAFRVLVDGPATFEAIHAAIDAAERYVLVQFFIIRDDRAGQALRDRLIAAAGRGVTVRLLYDAVGSHSLSWSYINALKDAGVDVIDKHQSRLPSSRFKLNFRNHRKTVIVDGKVGFTGGHNVGDEYMGRSESYGHWRDTHAELRGPIVSQLQLTFAEDWHWACEQSIIDDLSWDPDLQPEDKSALMVPTGPSDPQDGGALFFFSAIAAARDRVWITSPYFVPDVDVLTALKHAAMRGVEVRLLLPAQIDHYLPWLAAFAFFDEVLEEGVEIWRYKAGFLHQKVVVVDEVMGAVGTTNLDNRSFRLNFEAMAVFFDGDVARELAEMLARDFGQAERLERRLDDQRWPVRLGAPVARLFAPLL